MSHHLLIYCCKGLFRDENRDELYHLLDVDRRATAADLKKAFRNKSLQMHPDKLNQRGREVTDEDKANFQKMKSAYDVLSDPQKREVYDQMGETGMLMMEDPFGAMDNMILVKNFLRMETRDRLRLVIFVLLFVSAVLLWPILFCAKVDGDTSWSWVGIWTPLWIYDALGLWHFMYLVGLGKLKPPQGMEEDDWTDPYPFPLRILALVKWVLLVIFQIFLTLRLDHDINWTYAAVVTPLLALVTLRMIFHVYEGTRPVSSDGKEDDEDEDDEEEEDDDDEEEDDEDDDDDEDDYDDDDEDEEDDDDERQQALAIRTKARLALLQDCFWMMQLVSLIIQLDSQIEWSWWVIFLPTWMVMFFQLVGFFVDIMRARKLACRADEERLNEDDRAYVEAATEMTLNAVRSCCCWTFACITVVLAVAAIAGAGFSAFVVSIPLFLIAGVVMCCMTCLICLCRDLPEEEDAEGDEEQGGLMGTSPLHYGATS